MTTVTFEELTAPKRKTLTFEDLVSPAPHPPMYGPDGKPISEEEYQSLFRRPSAPEAPTPLGRVGEAAVRGYARTMAPDVPLGPSPETVGQIASIPYVGGILEKPTEIGGAAADFVLRGLTAPFSAANEAIGQTAIEAGSSQGMAERLKRDLSGLTEAGLLVSGTAPYAPRIPRAAQARPIPKNTATFEELSVATKPEPTVAAKTKPQPDVAGNINLNRIYAPEDVKAAIRQTAEQNKEFIGARRGVISHEETREMAGLVGMTPEKLSQRIRGQAFNPEEMFAARELLVNQATKVRDLAKVAQGGADLDKMTFAEELTRLVAIQEQVSGATAEAGRTLSQFRMMAGASKEQIARLVEASKAGGLDDVIEKAAALDDPTKIAQFARDAFKANTSDKVLEVWINALLSGPVTHATNILSNTLVSAWAIPETVVAAGISKLTGSGIRGREVLARTFGFVEGAKEGIRAGWRTFKTEQPSDLASKIEARRYQAIKGAKGRIVRIPGRALMAEDEFFKAIGYRQEINAQAMRTALNEGLSGKALAQRISELKANPTEAMQTAARGTAELQTFTNPLGKIGRKVLEITNSAPALRVIMPFVRTPTNIIKFAAKRSPFAPLFKDVRENLAGTNGAIARDTQLARIALGSSVSAATTYLALEGAITGGGPSDPRERGLLYSSGWQPYSVKIGDKYYSYGRLEPLGLLLGVASDFAELSKTMSEEEQANVAALIMGSVQRNLISKTWLRGLSDLIEAFQDPERYGEEYIKGLAGTLIPTGVAQVARTNDPFLREARTILDKLKERIPGLRETLPVRRDILGEQIQLEGAVGPDILSPIFQSTGKTDPVIAELMRLDMAPLKPKRKIQDVELEPDEYDALQEITGQLIKRNLGRVISKPGWTRLSDEDKKDLAENLVNASKKAAREILISRRAPLRSRINLSKRKTMTLEIEGP